MTFDEWKAKYEQKAEKLIVIPGFQCYFEPDKGFFYWHQFGDVFEIDHTCTDDFRHMVQVANNMAKERGCKIMRTATFRNPAVYMRFMKATPNLSLSGIRPNGKMYWIFEKVVI
jgi:hypothetical protein